MAKPHARSNSRMLRQPTGVPANTRIRELTYLGRNHLGFQLSRALGQASEAGLLPAEADERVRERLIWLRTKYDALSVVGQRVREGWGRVKDKAIAADPSQDPYGLDIGRTEAVSLAMDAAALVTLLHATLETAAEAVTVAERALFSVEARSREDTLRTLLDISGAERDLFDLTRDAFAHSQAPWLAVLLTPDGAADLAILTRWRPEYAAGEGYLLLSQVEHWGQALAHHLDALEASLAERIRVRVRALEEGDSPNGR